MNFIKATATCRSISTSPIPDPIYNPLFLKDNDIDEDKESVSHHTPPSNASRDALPSSNDNSTNLVHFSSLIFASLARPDPPAPHVKDIPDLHYRTPSTIGTNDIDELLERCHQVSNDCIPDSITTYSPSKHEMTREELSEEGLAILDEFNSFREDSLRDRNYIKTRLTDLQNRINQETAGVTRLPVPVSTAPVSSHSQTKTAPDPPEERFINQPVFPLTSPSPSSRSSSSSSLMSSIITTLTPSSRVSQAKNTIASEKESAFLEPSRGSRHFKVFDKVIKRTKAVGA